MSNWEREYEVYSPQNFHFEVLSDKYIQIYQNESVYIESDVREIEYNDGSFYRPYKFS